MKHVESIQCNFNRNVVEYLVFAKLILNNVEHCLNRANFASVLGPLEDGSPDFRWGQPVYEDLIRLDLSALRCRIRRILLVDHPGRHLLDAVQFEPPVDFGVLADGRLVQLVEGQLPLLQTFSILENKALPHDHLSLLSIDILLNGVELRPVVIGGQLELQRVNHLLQFKI